GRGHAGGGGGLAGGGLPAPDAAARGRGAAGPGRRRRHRPVLRPARGGRTMSQAPPRHTVDQAALFRWLRWRMLRNSFRSLAGHSFVRFLTIVLVSVTVWVFVYVVSHLGFRFLQDDIHLPLKGDIIGRVIDLMFLSLGALLIFSSGLILYGSLFGSAETAFLLSNPAAADQVFAYKFQGAVGFSSWAFLLLGGPVLIAYGVVGGVPWHYYAFL